MTDGDDGVGDGSGTGTDPAADGGTVPDSDTVHDDTVSDGDTVLVPGGRDVRATLDAARGGATAGRERDACVVACPPHPQHRGHRGDGRLVAVSDALTERGVDCLRFDYGDWDEGRGELVDARNAVGWARERYDAVGLFGFSFGGCIALNAAAGTASGGGTAAGTDPAGDTVPGVAAVSVLSPARRLPADLDSVAALDDIDCPVQVVYGTRDDTVDWEPTVERARELGHEVVEFPADHFYVGQTGKVGEAVGEWLADRV